MNIKNEKNNENYYNELVARKLEQLLREKSITSSELSQKSKIDKSKISRFLNKKGVFSVPELHMISRTLNTDINYFISEHENILHNIIPILDITKLGSNRHLYQISISDYEDVSTLLGVYIGEFYSTYIIPVSSVLIINLQKKTDKKDNRPIVYLMNNKLYIGIWGKNNDIINISDSSIISINQINILGVLERQIVDVKKNVYPEKQVFLKHMSVLNQIDLRYNFLYKLLLSS